MPEINKGILCGTGSPTLTALHQPNLGTHKIKADFRYNHAFPFFPCSLHGNSLLACLCNAAWLEHQSCIHGKYRYLYIHPNLISI